MAGINKKVAKITEEGKTSEQKKKKEKTKQALKYDKTKMGGVL